MENTCLREALAFGDGLEFLYWKMILVVLRRLTGCEMTCFTSTLSVYWIVVFGRLLGYWIVINGYWFEVSGALVMIIHYSIFTCYYSFLFYIYIE